MTAGDYKKGQLYKLLAYIKTKLQKESRNGNFRLMWTDKF